MGISIPIGTSTSENKFQAMNTDITQNKLYTGIDCSKA